MAKEDKRSIFNRIISPSPISINPGKSSGVRSININNTFSDPGPKPPMPHNSAGKPRKDTLDSDKTSEKKRKT